MKYFELIKNLNSMREFVEKGYELPFTLRRAIRLNDEVMVKEYIIFDEERNRIKASELSEDEINNKLVELANTEVDVKIEKCNYDVMQQVTIPITDENMIMFMLEIK